MLATLINAAFRLPEISLRYIYKLLQEREAAAQPMSHLELQDEIRWREQSHQINPESAYSSLQPLSPSGMPSTDADALPPIVQSIQAGTVASFPLRYNHADQYLGEGQKARTVLIGDAAHTIHPLAGQGLNLGLGDAESLTRCIEAAVSSGGDIGIAIS
jgi:ubiquinone biosynthesis monooxygenase Coq6